MSKDTPRLFVYLMKQDDPKKCTSAKLFRFGQVTAITRPRTIPRLSIVLDPFATLLLSQSDREAAVRHGICAIDCSWEKAQSVFKKRFSRNEKRLPILLAANPTHYAQPSVLSSVEALAGALIILGMRERAASLLSLFKWGPTFLSLNQEPLQDYAAAKNALGIEEAQKTYF